MSLFPNSLFCFTNLVSSLVSNYREYFDIWWSIVSNWAWVSSSAEIYPSSFVKESTWSILSLHLSLQNLILHITVSRLTGNFLSYFRLIKDYNLSILASVCVKLHHTGITWDSFHQPTLSMLSRFWWITNSIHFFLIFGLDLGVFLY